MGETRELRRSIQKAINHINKATDRINELPEVEETDEVWLLLVHAKEDLLKFALLEGVSEKIHKDRRA